MSVVAGLLAGAIGYWLWLENEEAGLPDGIGAATGVLTAVEISVAAQNEGVVTEIIVKPGTPVLAGAPVMRLRFGDQDATVIAPHAGRLDNVIVKAGDRIERGQIVARIVDLADLALVAPFPASVGAAIRMGAEARISFPGFRATPIPARVTSVVPTDGDYAGERALTVVADIRDTRGLELKPGQRGRVFIRLKEGVPWPARVR
jgi:HlyD family secretion protein